MNVSLFTMIRVELYKIAMKPRSYIGFGAILVIIAVIQGAMYADGETYIKFVTQSLEQSFFVGGKILNGSLVCFVILQTLILQIPLLVALVSGDLISGEAATGTLRFIATRPASRLKIITAKYFAALTYTFVLLLWLGILALGLGILFFGQGDLVVLKSQEMVIIAGNDVIWRFFAAFGVAFLSMVLVATLSFMLSCFTDNSLGPIIITMAVIILFTIIGTIDLPLFDKVRPLLFTTHMLSWKSWLDNPIPIDAIMTSVYVLLGHIAVFFSVAAYRFKKKDILV